MEYQTCCCHQYENLRRRRLLRKTRPVREFFKRLVHTQHTDTSLCYHRLSTAAATAGEPLVKHWTLARPAAYNPMEKLTSCAKPDCTMFPTQHSWPASAFCVLVCGSQHTNHFEKLVSHQSARGRFALLNDANDQLI